MTNDPGPTKKKKKFELDEGRHIGISHIPISADAQEEKTSLRLNSVYTANSHQIPLLYLKYLIRLKVSSHKNFFMWHF